MTFGEDGTETHSFGFGAPLFPLIDWEGFGIDERDWALELAGKDLDVFWEEGVCNFRFADGVGGIVLAVVFTNVEGRDVVW